MNLDFDLKEERLRQGLTQRDLAELAGVSNVAIHYYECGERRPRKSTVLALKYALGLLNGNGRPEATAVHEPNFDLYEAA